MSHVLVLNAGSSSLKFGLFNEAAEPDLLLRGKVDRIGGSATLRIGDEAETLTGEQAATHQGALAAVLKAICTRHPDAEITAVGHRVVHGGMDFAEPVILTPQVMERLARFVPFAPLHQPHNLAGVRAALQAFPQARQVACFDTAFHRQHPFVNDTFALPRAYYDKGVRRYGFHGLSYDYIAGRLAEIAPTLHSGRVIVAHLGNGASMCGLLNGRSIASSMGFSALDGLPMGTRSGQLDPGVVLYLMQEEGLNADEIADLLYRRSGLLGMSGISNDMRTLLASDDRHAREAVEYFCFRIQRELGGLAAALQGLDAIVFTGGIGENAAPIRQRVCDKLRWIGVELDETRNLGNEREISADLSRVRVLVMPTNEELVIARAATGTLG
ncbi:acetate/propionate family kinase [Antarctobacter jejuensis]|uniref:acetate/propionate family kinase n=1 Tax=Antarctobacter jejuensis TaxID=1439938 RepID=UPI003FD645B0